MTDSAPRRELVERLVAVLEFEIAWRRQTFNGALYEISVHARRIGAQLNDMLERAAQQFVEAMRELGPAIRARDLELRERRRVELAAKRERRRRRQQAGSRRKR